MPPTSPSTARPQRRMAQFALGMASVATAAAVAASLVSAAPAQAATVTNLIKNSTFESNTLGWNTNADAVAYRYGGGHNSAYSARVVKLGTTTGTALLNDYSNTVSSTVAGRSYTLTLMVRTQTPNVDFNARLMEYKGSTLVGQANQYVWLQDSTWKQVSFTYVAKSDGGTIDVNLMGWKMAPKTSFLVDNVSLVAATSSTTTPAPVSSTPAPATSTASAATAGTASGWKLAWADEFNGTSVDRTKWNVENLSTYGDGNQELACLMDRPENLAVNGGVLTLRARREATPIRCGSYDSRFVNGRSYTSAHLQTRGKASFNYGRFEIRAKLPTQANTSNGLWPAFWMRPVAGGTGELDILEAIGGSAGDTEYNKVHQTLWYDYSGTYKRQTFTHTLPSGSLSDGFHTYAAEWEPHVIRWYVDGKLTFQRDRTTTSWIDDAFAPGKMFYLRLNLAVGGTWPGSPDAATRWPADYQVDYVRVYQR